MGRHRGGEGAMMTKLFDEFEEESASAVFDCPQTEFLLNGVMGWLEIESNNLVGMGIPQKSYPFKKSVFRKATIGLEIPDGSTASKLIGDGFEDWEVFGEIQRPEEVIQ